jgi:hydroxymethylpyrimidine pyrophosphatase-like HAD family hydrolase
MFTYASVSTSVSSTVSSTFSSSDIEYMRITANGASIYNPTGSPQWSTVSDRRIKENIEKASYDKCYDNINKLELYRFNYIKELNNINKDIKQLGYIAQEVEDIFPKAISTQQFYNNSLSIPDLLSIDISQINYSLYGAVKKLIEIDKNKEDRIKKMEYLLNIDTPPTSNITIDAFTSNNITIDTLISTSNNMYINSLTSNNMYTDISTSNNISFYTHKETNIIIDITESMTSNMAIE